MSAFQGAFEIGRKMGIGMDRFMDQAAFRLELVLDKNGKERIVWHGQVDGQAQTFDVDPYTGFWRRLGIGFLGLFPIDSQL